MDHGQIGKYAIFIWAAYGLTAVVFLGMIVSSLANARRWRRRAEGFSARADDRPQ